ncbi:MAG: HEAT repeat domain-containing protein [Planctomycetes bacterium]|nr:HEAT repeat domain-containing protein [Planctomycetota bacterium]
MLVGAATNVCGRGSVAAAALLAACAGAGAARSAPLDGAQVQLVRAAEQAYRSGAADYPALRQQAAADPATAKWLTRMFVRDLFAARERPVVDEQGDLLRAATGADDALEERARAEIVALGTAAVPTLVEDLLSHGQPQPRQFGVELLAAIGAPAVPAVRGLAASADPRQRRAAGRALGAIGAAGDVLPLLRRLAADPDFAVRADALREIHDGGAPARALLVEQLQRDADPFVRRTAAEALARFPGATSATALIDYLERCKRDGDHRGEQAAQASLQALAGARGPRTPAAWRAFAATQTDPTD